MKTKTIGLALLLLVAAGGMCFAANPTLGTWKLDESKSKFGEGAGKPATVVWEKTGDKDKCTVDGVDAAGKKTHSVWTGKLDGKVVGDGKVVVAADGKTRTVTNTTMNPKGEKVTSTLFYDKS
jgi:hypothetical protein